MPQVPGSKPAKSQTPTAAQVCAPLQAQARQPVAEKYQAPSCPARRPPAEPPFF